MNQTMVQIALYVLVPLVTGLVAYIMKTTIGRLDDVEKKASDAVSEAFVRRILDDKIAPIQEDLRDIKDKLDKLFDLYINKK